MLVMLVNLNISFTEVIVPIFCILGGIPLVYNATFFIFLL